MTSQQSSSIVIFNCQFVVTTFSVEVSEGNDNLSSADSYNIISTQRIGIRIRIVSWNKDATFWRWFWSRGGSSCSSCRCRCRSRSRSRGNLDWNSKLRVIGGAVLIRTKSLQDSYVCLCNNWRDFKFKKILHYAVPRHFCTLLHQGDCPIGSLSSRSTWHHNRIGAHSPS